MPRTSYNSCRNRHCPKCQNSDRVRWLQQRQAELLRVEYFHVVFTLPEPIARLAFYNPETLYGILFGAAARTLLTIAADPRRLGAQIGFFATARNATPARRVSALIPNRQNARVTSAPTRIRPQKLQPPRTVLSLVIAIRPHHALFSPSSCPTRTIPSP